MAEDTTVEYTPALPVPVFVPVATWVVLTQTPNQLVTPPVSPTPPGAGNVPEDQ